MCISHDHYDHFDLDTLRWLARRFDPQFIAPLRHHDLLLTANARRIVELDWWQSHRPMSGVEITLTPTKHWSNRLGTPRNYRLWGGFWAGFSNQAHDHPAVGSPGDILPRSVALGPIENREPRSKNPARSVWFVGDSGYDEPLFRRIRDRLGAPDLALVPIGAYEPRWFMAPMHMNPAEAVRLHRDVGAKISLAMHWGTFPLTDEAREAPLQALNDARLANHVGSEAFRVLAPGESVLV